MKTRMQSDIWIQCTGLVLGFILAACIMGVAISVWMKHPMPGVLVALGFVSAAGLGKLLISPLK